MKSGESGFTLLEAIVALAIFALGVSAMYAWLNTNLITLQRVGSVYDQTTASESALAMLGKINIADFPSGKQSVGDLEVRWVSSPLSFSGDVLDPQNAKTIHNAQLYEVFVRVFVESRLVHEFTITKIGVKQVRGLESVLFG